MASDNESTLTSLHSDMFTTSVAKSTISKASSSNPPARNTRFVESRLPVGYMPIKSRQPPIENIPTGTEDEEMEDQRGGLDSETESLHLQTPGPGSSVSQSFSSDTSRSQKARSKTSWIHEHISIIRRNNNPFWQCNYCSKFYKATGGSGTFSKHLKTVHHIDPKVSSIAQKRDDNGTAVDTAIRRQAESIQAIKQEEQKHQERILDKITLEYLYIRWTTIHSIAFNQVSHSEFRDFLEYLNPTANRLLPSAPQTIRSHALALMDEGKKRLRYIIKTALSDIHITCDIWTSLNHLGILAVVAHFTNEKSQLLTVTLALVELEGKHSGQNQAQIINKIIDDFHFRNKLGFFVMDNAESNDTLIQAIAFAQLDHGLPFDPLHRRLRCNGHIINLVVQAFLFGQAEDDYDDIDETTTPSEEQLARWRRLGPLGKLHNIIVWISASPQRIQSFKKLSHNIMPRRDNSTRWNSWYEMIDRAIVHLKGAIIQTVYDEEGLTKDTLTNDDWRILTNIRDFLRAFYDTTKATEGRKATLEMVLPSLDFMANKFEEAISHYQQHQDQFMMSSLQAGWTKVLKYWNRTERSPIYIAAIVLDPTLKWSYFDDWNPEWQPGIRQKLKDFWETNYRPSAFAHEQAHRELDTNNQFLIWLQSRRGTINSNCDELEQYLSEPSLLQNDRTALDWWLDSEQRTRLPFLSKMAIDVFSVPAMSSEPERVFSGAKHTLTEQRMRCNIETIQLLECLKSWFRLGIYTEEDLHTIISAEQAIDQSEASEALNY